jgi:hypothetical protein
MVKHDTSQPEAAALAAAVLSAAIPSARAQQPPAVEQVPAPQPPRVTCDRACLRKALDTYMGAVFKHDPGAAGLSADHYATENTAEVKSGERFWKAFSGYGAVNRGFFDPLNGSAAFLGVLKQIAGEDRITSVRIKVDGGKVSEAEWIVAGEGTDQGKPTPQGLIDYPPPSEPLPPAERSTRFMVKSLVSDFYQAVDDHTGEWIPSDPKCYRVENGGPPTWKWGCLGHFEAFDQRVREVSLRRFPLIDEEMGVVLCSVIFQHYPGKTGHDTLVHEYIQIRKDQVHAWWTSMYFLPPDSPTTNGWENRHWQWR